MIKLQPQPGCIASSLFAAAVSGEAHDESSL